MAGKAATDQRAAASPGKEPRTSRGRETLGRLFDAAAAEFAERGFHEASISGITRRASMALGSFYTYFDSKDAIFAALVRHMSASVAQAAAASVSPGSNGVKRETEAFTGFLRFAREHKELYRIIEEAEFADPQAYRDHYMDTAARIVQRFDDNVACGSMTPGDNEVRAWAVMGMNVFLGLRFGVWGEERSVTDISAETERMLREGLA